MRASDAAKYAQKLVDTKLGEITRFEMLEEDPTNPEPNVVYLIKQTAVEPDIPTDYLFRFDAMELDLTNNANVTEWADSSGNGNTLTQSSASDQPIYLAEGLNGKPTVNFLGDFLYHDSFTLDRVNGLTAFVVTGTNVGSASSTIFSIGDLGGNTHSYLLNYSGSGQKVRTSVNQSTSLIAANDNDGTPTLYTVTYDGSELAIVTNGSSSRELAVSGDLNAHDRLVLGGRVDGFQSYYGKISEIIYFSRALSATEINEMNTYLVGKWGIS